MRIQAEEQGRVLRSRGKRTLSEKNRIRGRSRRRKRRHISKVFLFLYTLLLLCGISYVIYSQRFRSRFFPNTYVNGINASGKTVQRVKKEIEELTGSYALNLKSRGNQPQQLKGEDVGLSYLMDEALEDYVSGQNIYFWAGNLRGRTDIKISTMTGLDEDKLSSVLSGLHAFDPALMKSPKDASISDYIEGIGYRINPEEQGTLIDIEKARKEVRHAVLTLEKEIDLDDPSYSLYQKPAILKDDPNLKSKLDLLNRYVSSSIQYDKGVILDAEEIHQWISPNQSANNMIDYTQADDFVAELSKAYNTVYRPKEFQTHEGMQIILTGGNYGWKVNQIAEAAAIKAMVSEGKVIEGRKPEFSKRAAAFGDKDYGNTYAEVNLSKQKLYFYKEGSLVMESDIVSGDEAKGFLTPAGVYQIAYKQENAVLKGEDYNANVAKWMPFNGNIGFHDANWRESFGGEIYKNGGSHGCINLPPQNAEILYENIETGTPVICYYEDGRTPKNINAEPGTTGEEVQIPAETAEGIVKERAPARNPAEAEAAPAATQTAAESFAANAQTGGQEEVQPSTGETQSSTRKKKKRRRKKSPRQAPAQSAPAQSTPAESTPTQSSEAALRESTGASSVQETVPPKNPPIRINQNGPGMESSKGASSGPGSEGGKIKKEEKGPGIDTSMGSPPLENRE